MSERGERVPPAAAAAVEVLPAGAERHDPAEFAGLVRPLTTQEFLDTRYREKRPVLFRAEAPRFASLCSWEQLNELLCSDAWYVRMKLVKEGRNVPSIAYTRPMFGLGWRMGASPANSSVLDGRRLQAMLRQGASVVLPGIHELHPPIRAVADAIEESLGGYAMINLYASWMASPGFATHWDDHDVFILQVAGTKRWQIYGETRRFPLTRDAEPPAEPPGEPVWNGMLRAGDVLYLPRGWWHDARAEADDGSDGAGSVHLTCSINAVTGIEFMEWLSGRLARHEHFRRDLPHPTDRSGGAHYAALRELLLRELDGDLKRQFDDHMRATWSERSRPGLGPYLDPWKSPDWERCEIRLRGARHAALERGADGEAVLQANGYRWTFDGRCMELLATLLRGAPVRAGAFREALPEGAAADLADDFLKLLVEQGIATAAPPAGV